MQKNIKKITVILSIILLPIICLIGIFSVKADEKYNITATMNNGVVSLLEGEFYGTNVSNQENGFKFLNTIKDEYGFDNAESEFIFDKSVDTTIGKTYRFKQVYNGIEVYGRNLSISVDENGRVIAVSGNYKKTNAKLINVDKESFKKELLLIDKFEEVYELNLVIYNQKENIDKLCFEVNSLYNGEVVDVILDAISFEIYQIASSSPKISNLSSYSFVSSQIVEQTDHNGNKVQVNVETYTNYNTNDTVYLLSDKNKRIYMTVMANNKTISDSNFYDYYLLNQNLTADDHMVVEAYKNLIKCYDFYADDENFGTSIIGLKNEAGKNINLIAVVHAREKLGVSYDNAAYWILNSNSSFAYFLFGDGGQNAKNYASSLDVVGHEYQHGITTSICNLEYLNEAGAINEAISDIFGAIIEGHDVSSQDFWLMGEDITLGTVGFRDMSNPKNEGLDEEYPMHINEMYPLCTNKNCSHARDDYGGVHYNSSILTYATYKMYTYDTEFFTTYRIGELWYNTLTRLSVTSTFADFRVQMLSSASALGYSDNVIAIINRAFADVGLVSSDAEFKVNFFENQQDAENETNMIDSITAIYGSKITLPTAKHVPDGKLFYYWVDSQGVTYKAGSLLSVKYEDLNLWAYYVDIESVNWTSLEIELKGDGSTTDPYLIYSSVEWMYLAYLINNSDNYLDYIEKDYSLESDIDLNNIEYVPIGTMQRPFKGYLNGGNFTVNGLNLSKAGLSVAGLFGVSEGSICNLVIGFGETHSNAVYTGSIVGINYGYITNCACKLSIISKATVGGITGISYALGGNSVVNSYNEGNITGDIVGGISGEAVAQSLYGFDVIASSYIGNVYSTGELKGNIVGGIVGRANGYYIINSMATGSIEFIDTASDKIAGGIIGHLMNEPIDGTNEGNTDCYSAILSCKVVSVIENNINTVGMLVGKLFNQSTKGKIIIENNTMKRSNVNAEIGNLNSLSNDFKTCLIIDNNKFSNDGIYEGDFDFDNPDYFTNSDNWTITRSISLFNLESVWTINKPEEMPQILNYDFWINNPAENFSGGNGSTASPFLISSAEELALLSVLVSNSYYNAYYSSKAYKLTRDIDLTGKIWVGIGCTVYTYASISQNYSGEYPINIEYYGFSGSFDGAGYTITGMNSISAYAPEDSNEDNIDYYAYNYDAGLFSLLETNIFSNSLPVITNLNLRNVSVSGAYAGALVAVARCSAVINNVYVHSGNINGSAVAGGLIGVVGGTAIVDYENALVYGSNEKNIEVQISNTMNNARVSARVVGGIIGKADNLSLHSSETAVKIQTSVSRGKLIGFGDEVIAEPNYYISFVGGLVGVSASNSLTLNNNIFIGNILMYTPGEAGGLVGATAYAHNYNNTTSIQISSMYNKIAGNINYKFENLNNNSGSYLGAVLENSQAVITINDNNSITSISGNTIGKEFQTISKSLNVVYSSDEINQEGEFDFDNLEYYNQAFSNNSWTASSVKSMIVLVSFVDYDGDVISSFYVPYGYVLQNSDIPNVSITRLPDEQYTYEFAGFEDMTGKIIDQDIFVRALYNKTSNYYTVTYKLQDGTIIEELTQAYGSKISQDIKAPEKKSNFFVTYKFDRWEFESDTVTGNMIGIARYKSVIGTNLLIVLLIVVIIIIATIYIVNYFLSKKKKQSDKF